MRKQAPDFFIIGAPKCGTTALASYLSDHPRILFSTSKEPNFYSSDLNFHHDGGSQREYMERYYPGDHDGMTLGEGTPFYLYSEVATRKILEANPNARFIVMLREPVAQAISMHSQRVLNAHESERDFETAWKLQAQRRLGQDVPAACPDARILLYEEIADYPSQLERLFRDAPREQVHIILFDDLSASTAAVYDRVLDFLGLEAEGPRSFERVHERKTNRSQFLAHFLSHPPKFVLKTAQLAKRVLGLERLGLHSRLASLNTNTSPAPPEVDPAFRSALRAHFRPQLDRLEEMIDRDLSGWR